MIQKLRIKFLALAMGLLFLVLAVIMGTVNLLNYRRVLNEADSTLEILVSNGGRFPDRRDPEDKFFNREIPPELPFETRFFTVHLNADGEIGFADTGKIAAVSTETAIAYAKQVWDSQKPKGFIGEYRYALHVSTEGGMAVFLDCGRGLHAARSFLRTSLGISLAGFSAVSLLLYLFSARIVKPISESHEKQAQFITNASHDLKTPITIIDADVDVLIMEQGENEWLQDIQKQTGRLAELIRELVYLSRMEEKDSRFQMIDFPLSDVVSEAAASFDSLAVSTGKSFTVQIQPMLSFCGDEKAFRQLISVLLDNALKYSGEQGVIRLTLEKTDRFIRLSVYNTSEPIAQEDIKRLFDRFYRADKSRNAQTGGYGIGLSIAKAIVSAHRGTISASSADGRSLTVTAKFPA